MYKWLAVYYIWMASERTHQFWNTGTYLWYIFTLLCSGKTKRLEIMYLNKFILYCTLGIPNILKLWTMSVTYSVPFQEIADKEIREFPLNSAPVRIHNRCILTSRPRAVLKRWHVSRIMFRSLADYNNLSGVTRSSWWFISIKHIFFVHFTLHEIVFWCDFYKKQKRIFEWVVFLTMLLTFCFPMQFF